MISTEFERYHLEQYEAPYESTKALGAFILSVTGGPLIGSVLDVGCGGGAVVHWLDVSGVTRRASITGLDRDWQLIELARRKQPDRVFELHDLYDPLPRADVVLSVQVLSFIEDWRPALERLLEAAGEWVFVTSLFWRGVSTHTHASDAEKSEVHYNVIDMSEFERACGGRIMEWREIPLTRRLVGDPGELRSRVDGRWTMSGPLLMPWWMVAIKK